MTEISAEPQIPPLFINRFEVDRNAPFRRYLNRLEVEIGREDYQTLLMVERLWHPPSDRLFFGMDELTDHLLELTQNVYNRDLLREQGVRIYLDRSRYHVYYRLAATVFRFVPVWRDHVLQRFIGHVPTESTAWHPCVAEQPGFEVRFLADEAGGTLLLRRIGGANPLQPLLTAAHGPYDPHTLEVVQFFLRSGRASAAIINLGYSGREPLTDTNVGRLARWGLPLNPSNLDLIFPYTDHRGIPFSYKTERHLRDFVEQLELPAPELIIDVHGCVGTGPDDQRLIVGLGGLPPYRVPEELGEVSQRGSVVHLKPSSRFRQGLSLLRELSDEFYVQFCQSAKLGYHYAVLGKLQLMGRKVDLTTEVDSLLDGEERTYLPAEQIRWIPGAGANALQRVEASLLNPDTQCIHVEIPTAVRQKIRLRLKALAIGESLDSSSL